MPHSQSSVQHAVRALDPRSISCYSSAATISSRPGDGPETGLPGGKAGNIARVGDGQKIAA